VGISDWIGKEYLDPKWLLKASKTFKTAKPFPHIVLKKILKKEKFQALEKALSNQEFIRKESDLFSFSQTNDLTESQDDVLADFMNLINGAEFREWLDGITGTLCYHGKADGFGAIYGNTDYLLCHDDQLEKRRTAYILYFTSLKKDQGGRLRLYSNKNKHPDKIIKSYVPEQNSLALFDVSPKSWHEVEEVVNGYRVSIGGWFHD
jgi:prolyl 3-hydroxylase /prolyl 3,4-dihydroxylase